MGFDDLNISRHCRTATAMSVLLESGVKDRRERAGLLGSKWKGWREVMCIKLAAAIYCDQQYLLRRGNRNKFWPG